MIRLFKNDWNDEDLIHREVNDKIEQITKLKRLKYKIKIVVDEDEWLWSPGKFKEQTKMQIFVLEGPRPCTIFCFAHIHEL